LDLREVVLTQQTLSAILHSGETLVYCLCSARSCAGLAIRTLTTFNQLHDLEHLSSLESLQVYEDDVSRIDVSALLPKLSRLHSPWRS
jgi:hypothetical protein